MGAFIVRRLLQMLIVLFLLTIISFMLTAMRPTCNETREAKIKRLNSSLPSRSVPSQYFKEGCKRACAKSILYGL
ncbi:hypothetical protein ES708_05550 [subsurface metagenome]